MIINPDDTITAIATAPGGALRGVIRISGPDCLTAVLSQLSYSQQEQDIEQITHPMVFSGSFCFQNSLPSVNVDVYYWPTNRSYTRQPSLELHTIGSPPILQAILDDVCRSGARLAEPGEFTMRSFLAGRLDLTQAEAVLGVIESENSTQLDIALTQLAGGMSRELGQLRDNLLNLLAELEAGLDFVEEDIEFITSKQIARQLETAELIIEKLLEQMRTRSETNQQFRAVLLGAANVGKSSLFNALTHSVNVLAANALVSNIPGTTRDYLTAKISLPSIHCELVDTAGLEYSETDNKLDEIDQHAQNFSQQQQETADLVLYCIDSTQPISSINLQDKINDDPQKTLLIYTKIDACKNISELPKFDHLTTIKTSSVDNTGLDDLQEAIQKLAHQQTHYQSSVINNTAVRCRASLTTAHESIQRARNLAAEQNHPELVAFEIRHALDQIGLVVGTVYTDDILDRIFGQFCIGK